MEQFSSDIKIGAYKILSEKEKEFIASEESTVVFQDIGTKNGLMLDATGKMSDISFLALVGLIKAPEVRTYLQKSLGLPDAKIDALVNDLNERIFVPFRHLLAEEAGKSPEEQAAPTAAAPAPITASAPMATPDIHPSREEILAEIEGPAPVSEPLKDTTTRNFVAAKLSQTVSMPSQKTVVPPEKPKSYAADPYREPVA